MTTTQITEVKVGNISPENSDMKQEYKQKLLVAFNNICNSIDKARPTLYFNYRDFHQRGLCDYRRFMGPTDRWIEVWRQRHDYEDGHNAGICSRSSKSIYINPSDKWRNVKRGYSDYLYTLIHELMHWYFPSFKHGFKFEKKIGEIFKIIPEEYRKLPPWPTGPNEMVSILCPKCQCLVILYFDKRIRVFKKRWRKCKYCADPVNLRPINQTGFLASRGEYLV